MTKPSLPDAAVLHQIAEGLDRRIDTATTRSRRRVRSALIGVTLIAACGACAIALQPFTVTRTHVSCFERDPGTEVRPFASSSFESDAIDAREAVAFCTAAFASTQPSASTPFSAVPVACAATDQSIIVISDPRNVGSIVQCRDLGYAPAR